MRIFVTSTWDKLAYYLKLLLEYHIKQKNGFSFLALDLTLILSHKMFIFCEFKKKKKNPPLLLKVKSNPNAPNKPRLQLNTATKTH